MPKPVHSYDPITWRRLRCLGVGGEGTADLHVNRWTPSQLVVVKITKMERTSADDKRPIEMKCLDFLPKCNRIIEYFGAKIHEPKAWECSIFLEYCPMGDLYTWRRDEFEGRNNKKVPESMIWRCFIQMSQALAFIHDGEGLTKTVQDEWQPIIHRDIKPQNILVVSNGSPYPSFKLADFGCSTLFDEDKLESECGTYAWQPPEMPRINTRTADVWSVGAVIHFLALGSGPAESPADYVARNWRRWGNKYPTGVDPRDRNYWDARVERRPWHINVSKQDQIKAGVHANGVNPDYSDVLDSWVMRALHQSAMVRVTVKELLIGMTKEGKEMIRKMAGLGGLYDLELKCEQLPVQETSEVAELVPESSSDWSENEGEDMDVDEGDEEGHWYEVDMDKSGTYRN